MSCIILGRFQPFHLGHKLVYNEASQEHDNIYILIGSAYKSHTQRNPFTCSERYEMIQSCVDAQIIPIPDINRPAVYEKHIQSLVPHYDTLYSNSTINKQLFEDVTRTTQTLVSGTMIRERIRTGQQWKHLVPGPVYEYITNNNLQRRC